VTLSGASYLDPYRWLEKDSEEVRRWQRSQAELCSAHVRQWPHFDRLRELVARFSPSQKHGDQYRVLPRFAAGRWFRVQAVEDDGSQVIVADEPMGEGQVLYDTALESGQRSAFVSWIAPSPDGGTIALGLCCDGSETNTIRLIDLATRRVLSDPPEHRLMDNWTGGAQWLPDCSGFFFSGISGAAVDFDQHVYLHRRWPKPATVRMDIGWTEAREYRWITVSPDGQYAVALERLVDPIPVAVAALSQKPLKWRPFVTKTRNRLAGHIVGDRYIAVTDVGAPRGRLVAIPLDADDPNDPRCWEELVGESDAVLQTFTVVKDLLYLTEFVDTYCRVRMVDVKGESLGELPLPGLGALGSGWWYPLHSTPARGHPEKFLFTFSSFTASPGIYCHTPGSGAIEALQPPRVTLPNIVVESHSAVSADGTRIPYRLVRRADVGRDEPQPTLIYAYGGYNYPLVPEFPGATAAFIAAGGVYVHAHLRGGAEFGRDWGHAGRMRNKQNCYDDLYAVANDLIAANRSTPNLLALTGRSLGGLLAAVALTQRPDLWRVVVPRVPPLDLIAWCMNAYGRMALTMELADIETTDEVRRLVKISPYHLVRDGGCYPAVFLDVGDTDPRCPPGLARKFAARLQQANSSGEPILIHVWENVGHGLASDKDVTITENAEWLAFTLRHLGVNGWT
jgi:prolyl oligopeptidase